MVEITVQLEKSLLLFYTRIALCAGVSPEQVIRDALFKLAAELSLEALQENCENPL